MELIERMRELASDPQLTADEEFGKALSDSLRQYIKVRREDAAWLVSAKVEFEALVRVVSEGGATLEQLARARAIDAEITRRKLRQSEALNAFSVAFEKVIG